MFLNSLFVALGAALGGVGRYLVSVFLKSPNGFPWATFAVNVFGSLFLGVLSGWLARPHNFTAETAQVIRCFAVVGVCGGFTTFSTFSNETFRMIEDSQFGLAALYALASVAAGLVSVFLGYSLSR